MNLLSHIKDIWFKLMAKQLRLPSGLLAKLTGNRMNQSNELLYHLTLENLKIKDGDRILEIGFGNGKFFSKLNAKAKNLKITGIDHSPEMVAEAVRINKNLHKSGTMNVIVGSSDAMPFDTESFDKIFCINVIYFWEDPALHLKEILRVLKPGGYFCTGFRPKENLSKFPFAKFGFTLYTAEEWKNLIEENGFQFIKLENGKELEKKMNQVNTPFESLCLVCVR
ncbi:MAG: class I SAM-dependent methyltransferase [Saprospiraceae bacterium]